MSDLISVIVPAYNIEQYIEKTIQSIKDQTYNNIEIIIVDDGSSDKTSEILDKLQDNDCRIKVIHKKNGGVSSARIEGLKAAKGNWIAFIDGDDYVEPKMFEHLLSNAIEYSADISHCGYQMVFPSRIDYYHNSGLFKIQNNYEGIYDLLSGEIVEPGLCNKLYKREIIEGFYDDSDWDNDIKINEDLLMNYILFKRAKKSVFIDIPYYHYILRRGSASKSKSINILLDPIKVMDILYSSLNEETLLRLVYKRKIRLELQVSYQSKWKDQSKIYREKLREEIKEKNFVEYCDFKLKTMILLEAYLHPIYLIIRKIYDFKTGINKKYEIK